MTPECERLGLGVRPIEDAFDVEVLRVLRNATREGFSTDNHEITWAEQQAWWERVQGHIKGWLYITAASPWSVVGFGVLRQTDDSRWWTSVGVAPPYMGKGYGGAITADLVRRCERPVWATARRDNPAAIKLHRVADWTVTHTDERLVHFMTKPHVHAQARLAKVMQDAEYAGWNAVGIA